MLQDDDVQLYVGHKFFFMTVNQYLSMLAIDSVHY